MANSFASPSELRTALAQDGYLADEGLATALYIAMSLPQPLLLEGEAGVGKTQAAKSLAALLNTPLIRLQCYEGIDASEALYEWNYPQQLLGIRVAESQGKPLTEESLFTRDYLIERPLMQAVEHPGPMPAVLLIDEPTRGVDVGAREQIYGLLRSLADAGMAIVVASSDLLEIRSLCDRVLVMRAGRIVGELEGNQLDEEQIMILATGTKERADQL